MLQFQMRAAADTHTVTAVSIVGWSRGIFADFASPIGKLEEVNVTADDVSPGFTVVEEDLVGDTDTAEYSEGFSFLGNGFGIHFVRGRQNSVLIQEPYCHLPIVTTSGVLIASYTSQ